MAYDEHLANRIREIVDGEPGLSEKRMFGGLAFLVAGTMAVAASRTGSLMVRVDPALSDDVVEGPHVRPVRMRGREMNGWLHVDTDVLESDEDLRRWVGHGVAYARSLGPR